MTTAPTSTPSPFPTPTDTMAPTTTTAPSPTGSPGPFDGIIDRLSDDAAATFQAGLAERNAGVVDAATQAALAEATILVAGCGSIGGAAVEPLVRLGARRFLLADPGRYELNNLNRQNATVVDLDANKADVAAERILSINPHASVEVHPDGITDAIAADLVARADVIVDGVDVTTMSGLQAKVSLHEQASARRRPLFTGWDMAGAQYLRMYDYRRGLRPFDGRLDRGDLDRLSTWEVLQRLVPLRFVPIEFVDVVREGAGDPDFAFPQLVQAADVFGALASHVVSELVAGRQVRTHTVVDVYQAVRPTPARWRVRLRRPVHLLSGLARLRRA